MQQRQKAIIIGGGIGGLTAAIALRQAGLDATVYERAPELRELGAGLALWRNAITALERLGLAEAVQALAVPELSGGIRSCAGELLIDMATLDRQGQPQALSLVIHRAELLEILRRALGAEHVRLGARCTRFTQDAEGVTVYFADGTQARADLLIGADGLGSVVRTALFGAAAPDYAGYSAWRAVTSFDHAQLQGCAGESWGRGARFGIAPMSQGRVYWFASINSPAGDRSVEGRIKAMLLERFRGWHAPIPALIEATDAAAILHHDIYDRPTLRRWSTGRVSLLGDAAHPMTPNLGQGACQAIEDAVDLAMALRAQPVIADALRTYERRRIARTSPIVRQSRLAGRVGQWQNPLACQARDWLAKHVLARVQMRQVERLVRYDLASEASAH